ncbi:DNA repair protein RAD51 homolog 4 isoform X2 [Cryptomeria japonica]|uniref:DNA repair protein RAD51 homolog 4 isoform X2 n=1 Tax=Cryptomeria japonica TaxID=3369 RepID=UPI0027DAA076|nr:DNA repair protein RAD51 homolog 4 isoform X2 [Cryptomeria japonica]
MAPLRALNLQVLTPQVLQFFAAHGIISVEDFLIHDLYTLAAIAEHQGSSEVLKQAIAEILSFVDKQHAQWLTGAQLLDSIQQNKLVLPTGCEGVDSLLGGGLLEGTLTELVGPSASGKTQICLRATSHVAYHSQAAVMYLDTCNSFSSKRVVDFLDVLCKSSLNSKDQQGEFERTMKEIFHYNVFDIYSMLDLLHHTEFCMRTQDKNRNPMVRLLIVDSVSSVITPVLSGSNLQGHSLMISLGMILKKLALEYNLAVLDSVLIRVIFCQINTIILCSERKNNTMITNHTVLDKWGVLKPALGESWKCMPHVRLLLSRDPVNDICDISLIKHTSKRS